jgi:ATP-binding cassette subfamily A (ABC1) protein 3
MLCGLISPSSGDAEVEEMSITTDMDRVRSVIGVCPQEDILFPLLNAIEHLAFVAALKGLTGDVGRTIESALEEVSLMPDDHKNRRVSTFSGGMRRKLSIAIAILGDPRVCVLDEPTSGVDPVSKRSIWEVLRKARENRTLILTTHSMEEADNLSDYIYVLFKGKLKCGGSPMFLKHRYGVGYFLTVDKKDECDPTGLLHAT